MRLDHLEAVVKYALEQAESSEIAVLDYGDNENALDGEDAVLALKSMLDEIKRLKAHVSNCEVTVVDTERYDLMSNVYYEDKDKG